MSEAARNPRPPWNWRFPLTLALSTGLALPLAWNVEQGLEPDLNHWIAFGLGIVAAGVGGGIVAVVVAWLTRPRKGKHA